MRSLSAVLLIPIVLLDVWLGGVWFRLFVALIAILMAYEWTALPHRDNSLQFALHVAAALGGAFLPADVGVIGTLAAIVVIAVVSAMLTYAQEAPDIFWNKLGVPYVGLSALALAQVRADEVYGMLAIIWILVLVWAADILAYFSGRIIGGPKLAPVISPNKTWAGFGGAMAGTVLASVVVFAVAGLKLAPAFLLMAALLAVAEQGGDLFKSAFKRFYGVKDTGNLIPGHGGVIDRVDGLVAVAIAAALIGWFRADSTEIGRGLLVW